MEEFKHKALGLTEARKLIYTAMSKHLFYFRTQISKFVIEEKDGGIPLNPFMIFDYFLTDSVSRDEVRMCNNNLVLRCDEVWVFGTVSDGVLAEILQGQEMNKKIRYFKIVKSLEIVEVSQEDVEFEDEVSMFKNKI